MQWVKKTYCCLPAIWQSLHCANLKHVSAEMHIFQNATPCQFETCFRMEHVSERHATRVLVEACFTMAHVSERHATRALVGRTYKIGGYWEEVKINGWEYLGMLVVICTLPIWTPSYNHIGKAYFLYFEVEAPKGINLVMFRDSNVTFSAKIRKKIKVRFWVINLLMLQNTGYSASNGPISHRVAHKTWII